MQHNRVSYSYKPTSIARRVRHILKKSILRSSENPEANGTLADYWKLSSFLYSQQLIIKLKSCRLIWGTNYNVQSVVIIKQQQLSAIFHKAKDIKSDK